MDKLVSGWNVFRYAVTESILLWIARKRFAPLYNKKGQRPLVSIMMPTFKRAELLMNRTLPSILNQTYSNFEVIIVGDRTVDNTEALIKKLNDPKVRFFHLPEYAKYPKDAKSRWFVGGTPPRNYGLKMARGLWIAETDDDDVFVPDHVESLLNFAERGNYEFVSGCYEREKYGKKEIIDSRGEVPRIGGIETIFYRSYLRLFRYNLNCWRKAYNCPQEIDRQLRMYNRGVRIGFLEKVVTLVLPLPGSETVGLDALEIRIGKKLR